MAQINKSTTIQAIKDGGTVRRGRVGRTTKSIYSVENAQGRSIGRISEKLFKVLQAESILGAPIRMNVGSTWYGPSQALKVAAQFRGGGDHRTASTNLARDVKNIKPLDSLVLSSKGKKHTVTVATARHSAKGVELTFHEFRDKVTIYYADPEQANVGKTRFHTVLDIKLLPDYVGDTLASMQAHVKSGMSEKDAYHEATYENWERMKKDGVSKLVQDQVSLTLQKHRPSRR